MSTRSITTVRSRWITEGKEPAEWETNANIYRHWDGYLEGQGQWLFDFLNGRTATNGKCWTYAGRLAARLVCALQEDGHQPDLLPDDGPCGQEFHYVISVEYGMGGGELSVSVYTGPMTAFGMGGDKCACLAFNGTVEEYGKWLAAQTAPKPEPVEA